MPAVSEGTVFGVSLRAADCPGFNLSFSFACTDRVAPDSVRDGER